jgi:hypothetical protein
LQQTAAQINGVAMSVGRKTPTVAGGCRVVERYCNRDEMFHSAFMVLWQIFSHCSAAGFDGGKGGGSK